ncbi:MAG TPA: hypothetical protein VKT76_03760 [Bradyrhizobium sp.]|nr:hypothetical protein [Bradyrhizobium sp.]
MTKLVLAGTMVLVLATSMAGSAMAFNDDLHNGFHSRRFEGVRGFSGWRHGDWGNQRFVGGYASHRDDYNGGLASYCPAFSRCGAGLGTTGW